jgi:uncharacterized protein
MTPAKPLPDPSTPFWRALRERKLVVQHCERCSAPRYPSAPLCPECLSAGGVWTEIVAAGALWSYVIYHRALAAPFAEDIPYAVGIVELVNGLHIIAGIDTSTKGITIGTPMVAAFVDVTEEVTLLRWAPAVGSAARHA